MAANRASLNTQNPGIKRILSEVKKMESDPCPEFEAHPVENNLFDWHFVLRGPPDSPFEGGLYHGRIILPAQYPFQPPEFMFLCPQGRFEIGKKICLSISQHHPELWQPGWDIRTALTAIQSFMPTPGSGAIAALDYTDEERKNLALKSAESSKSSLRACEMLESFTRIFKERPARGRRAGQADVPPSDDERALDKFVLFLCFLIAAMLGRRVLLTAYPDVAWAEEGEAWFRRVCELVDTAVLSVFASARL